MVMRHLFIVNPTAGKKQRALTLLPEIQAYFSAHPGDYRIHITESVGDATDVTEAQIRHAASDGCKLRIYACGGDGTLNEVVNGMTEGEQNVELTSIPCGSGNDFVKTFGTVEEFCRIDRIIGGTARTVDAIRCQCGGHPDMLSLNIASVGMDASVGHKMRKYKNLPLVSGSMAYNLAIFDVMTHRIGNELLVTMETPEGIIKRSGLFLFALAASGQYYGSGYRGAPQADPGDGLLDFVLIEVIPRVKIIRFLPTFRSGDHLDKSFVHSFRGSSITMQSLLPITVNLDGECFTASGVSFEIIPNFCRFVLPKE